MVSRHGQQVAVPGDAIKGPFVLELLGARVAHGATGRRVAPYSIEMSSNGLTTLRASATWGAQAGNSLRMTPKSNKDSSRTG